MWQTTLFKNPTGFTGHSLATPGLLLQRKCDCGSHTKGNTCDDCAKKKSLLQRTANDNAASRVQPVAPEVRRSANHLLDAATRAQMEPPIGHDFSQVRAHAEMTAQHRDASEGEEGTPSAKSDETHFPDTEAQEQRSTGTEVVPPYEAVPAHTKGSGTTTTCPTKATVEKVTNKTADGVKYRTGMGAVTTIKVEPDAQNWDGTNIVESFPTGITSDCPKEFGISPCNGSSTFIVGASRNSPVFGALPATKNRFYDFHETRWKGGSLLHDRNPAGIDSCTISCEQNYSCGGTVIAKPTITRTFTKGKIGSLDVTNVSVSKT
jgi:hypothetical protein